MYIVKKKKHTEISVCFCYIVWQIRTFFIGVTIVVNVQDILYFTFLWNTPFIHFFILLWNFYSQTCGTTTCTFVLIFTSNFMWLLLFYYLFIFTIFSFVLIVYYLFFMRYLTLQFLVLYFASSFWKQLLGNFEFCPWFLILIAPNFCLVWEVRKLKIEVIIFSARFGKYKNNSVQSSSILLFRNK